MAPPAGANGYLVKPDKLQQAGNAFTITVPACSITTVVLPRAQ